MDPTLAAILGVEDTVFGVEHPRTAGCQRLANMAVDQIPMRRMDAGQELVLIIEKAIAGVTEQIAGSLITVDHAERGDRLPGAKVCGFERQACPGFAMLQLELGRALSRAIAQDL